MKSWNGCACAHVLLPAQPEEGNNRGAARSRETVPVGRPHLPLSAPAHSIIVYNPYSHLRPCTQYHCVQYMNTLLVTVIKASAISELLLEAV